MNVPKTTLAISNTTLVTSNVYDSAGRQIATICGRPVQCKYSNALLRRWILGEVEMIGAKTCPEFVDLAVWQVARGMKGV